MTCQLRFVSILFLAILAPVLAVGAPGAAKKKAARKPNPAFLPIEAQPGLPNVLLIGDSISIGYTLPVRERLQGKANVYRIPANGGPTTAGLAHLDAWLGKNKWDLIHFNWGLHDLKYLNKHRKTDLSGKIQVPLDEYEVNLKKLVEQLQKTGATLIWASTTPSPPGSGGRKPEDPPRYNAAAARVMKECGVDTNDLFAWASEKCEALRRGPEDVHFTAEGSALLADKVAAEIGKRLAACGRKKSGACCAGGTGSGSK